MNGASVPASVAQSSNSVSNHAAAAAAAGPNSLLTNSVSSSSSSSSPNPNHQLAVSVPLPSKSLFRFRSEMAFGSLRRIGPLLFDAQLSLAGEGNATHHYDIITTQPMQILQATPITSKFTHINGKTPTDTTIMTNTPVRLRLLYYEVTILSGLIFRIGLVGSNFATSREPGQYEPATHIESFGFDHGITRWSRIKQATGQKQSLKVGVTIGCGMILNEGHQEVFFTVDGKYLGRSFPLDSHPTEMLDTNQPYFGCVNFQDSDVGTVAFNFGYKPFVWKDDLKFEPIAPPIPRNMINKRPTLQANALTSSIYSVPLFTEQQCSFHSPHINALARSMIGRLKGGFIPVYLGELILAPYRPKLLVALINYPNLFERVCGVTASAFSSTETQVRPQIEGRDNISPDYCPRQLIMETENPNSPITLECIGYQIIFTKQFRYHQWIYAGAESDPELEKRLICNPDTNRYLSSEQEVAWLTQLDAYFMSSLVARTRRMTEMMAIPLPPPVLIQTAPRLSPDDVTFSLDAVMGERIKIHGETVFLGRLKNYQDEVAIKILPASQIATAATFDGQFFQHELVVPMLGFVIDRDSSPPIFYLVSQYHPNRDLYHYLQTHPIETIPLELRVKWMTQLLKCVRLRYTSYTHRHVPLRSLQFLLDSELNVRISSYALLTPWGEPPQTQPSECNDSSSGGSSSPSISSPPPSHLRWYPPESPLGTITRLIYGASDEGVRRDIWTLGLLFLEILTGKRPFHKMRTDRWIPSYLARFAPSGLARELSALSTAIPAQFGLLIRQCLELDPNKRPSLEQIYFQLSQVNLSRPDTYETIHQYLCATSTYQFLNATLFTSSMVYLQPQSFWGRLLRHAPPVTARDDYEQFKKVGLPLTLYYTKTEVRREGAFLCPPQMNLIHPLTIQRVAEIEPIEASIPIEFDEDSATSVMTHEPLTPLPNRPDTLLYYEVTIDSMAAAGLNSTSHRIGVGLAIADYPLNRLPGLERYSFAYHSNGMKFDSAQNSHGSVYGPKYSVGDTIGCGLDLTRREVFFTLNCLYLKVAVSYHPSPVLEYYYHPTVGLTHLGQFTVNLGTTPFKFDLTAYPLPIDPPTAPGSISLLDLTPPQMITTRLEEFAQPLLPSATEIAARDELDPSAIVADV